MNVRRSLYAEDRELLNTENPFTLGNFWTGVFPGTRLHTEAFTQTHMLHV